MARCREGERKFQREIQRYRVLCAARNLRFVRSNAVLYWRFLAYLEDRGYRPQTVQRFYRNLRTFLGWLGARSVRRLRREDVERYLLWFRQEHVRTPYTLRYMRDVLSVFFDFLLMYAGLRRNPATNLRIRTRYPQPERMDLFSPEETLLLLTAPREQRARIERASYPTTFAYRLASYTLLLHYLMLKLMLSTGIRPCEIASARREDLEENDCRLRVRTKGRQRYIVAERALFLSPRTVAELRELLLMSDEIRRADSEGRLFVHYRDGQPLESSYANRITKRWAARCGIRRIVYAYMCRYTYCTRLVEKGADPYSLKVLMGHKQMATSLTHYLKLSPAELRREWRAYNPLAERGAV